MDTQTTSGGAAGARELREYRFAFTGTAGAYFRIWLVNVALTVLTLGIYSAWAKVRTRRYFYGNTMLDGATFDYHAKPLSILVSRLVVVAFVALGQVVAADEFSLSYAVYFLLFTLLVPWAVVRGLAFNARYSSYRNVRFSFNSDAAAYRRAYWIFAPFALSGVMGVLLLLGGSAPASDAELEAALMASNWSLFIKANIVFYLLTFLIFPWLLRGYHRFKATRHSWGDMRAGYRFPAIGKYIGVLLRPLLLAVVSTPILILLSIIVAAVIGMSIGLNASGFGWWLAYPGLFLAYTLALNLAVAMAFHNYWSSVALPGGGRVECRFSEFYFAYNILLVNVLVKIFSLGLLSAWAKVRRARFLTDNMVALMPAAAFERAVAGHAEEESALGAEAGDMEGFDFDVGLI